MAPSAMVRRRPRELFYAAVSTTGSSNGLDGKRSSARTRVAVDRSRSAMSNPVKSSANANMLYGQPCSRPRWHCIAGARHSPIVSDQLCSGRNSLTNGRWPARIPKSGVYP